MCNAKPGFRCSAHILPRLANAVNNVININKEINDSLLSMPNFILSNEDFITRWREAQKELNKQCCDFESTSAGLIYLNSLRKRAIDHGDLEEARDLNARYEQGEHNREVKIFIRTTYKSIQEPKEEIVSSLTSKNALQQKVSIHGVDRDFTMLDAKERIDPYTGKTIGHIIEDYKLIEGEINKGGAGRIIEIAAGGKADSLRAADASDGDIKTGMMQYRAVHNGYVVTEDCKVTAFNPKEILTTTLDENPFSSKATCFFVPLSKEADMKSRQIGKGFIIDVEKSPALTALFKREYESFQDYLTQTSATILKDKLDPFPGEEVYLLPDVGSGRGEGFKIKTSGRARHYNSWVDIDGLMGTEERKYAWKDRSYYLRPQLINLYMLEANGKINEVQREQIIGISKALQNQKSFVQAVNEVAGIKIGIKIN